MTSDASGEAANTATPAAHKAAKDGNPQQLLEKLPAMLHGVMIQCADVFKNPTKQHPRAILHTNAVMRATIPATVDRFQQALDMLEIEILKAKAVLNRDLTKFYTAAELARQKEIEEEERKAALEREAEEERLRLQKQSEEAEKATAEAAAAEEAARVAAAAIVPPSTELDMLLDEEPPTSAQPEEQKDTDMDQLFEDMQDVESLKVEEDASVVPSVAGDSNPLDLSSIPLVAASASKDDGDVMGLDDSKSPQVKIKSEPSPDDSAAVAAVAAAVAATFEDPIILDSPLLPAADGDAEEPSAVDLFGEDPLNPTADSKDSTGATGAGGSMSIEEQIDMDFLFPGDSGGTGAPGESADAGTSTVDDLFGDLGVDGTGDTDKLDLMNLDIPGLGTSTETKVDGKPDDQKQAADAAAAAAATQPDLDINALGDPSSFDDLLASFGDGALLGQLGNDETSLFDDAFDMYTNP
ncbi:hypothetical protein H072_7031 [Dactylellina haptotyla CBS 200.50]|uniref:Uncharacterized protein n=1 Tax=Dactylellina haptotyla (strain CBS 200.50) TaxID=1284197 RepID=S8A8K6_DACHA|nr:hypothetical protein H072_7031 [Dactylellina haptotyla CBS 200.50]